MTSLTSDKNSADMGSRKRVLVCALGIGAHILMDATPPVSGYAFGYRPEIGKHHRSVLQPACVPENGVILTRNAQWNIRYRRRNSNYVSELRRHAFVAV